MIFLGRGTHLRLNTSRCSNLQSVSIRTNVQTIGDSAFYDCDSLTNVSIPKDVERIGTNAFGSCNKLTEINVDINNTNSTTIDGVLYDNNHSRLLQHPCGNNDSIYDIVDGMRTVGPHAFDGRL